MFWMGFKFGLGLWLGMVALSAAVFGFVYLRDQLSRYRVNRRQAARMKAVRERLQEALCMSTSELEAVRGEDRTQQTAVLKMVFAWRNQEQPDRPRREPQYRH
jgi:hypothetical protein